MEKHSMHLDEESSAGHSTVKLLCTLTSFLAFLVMIVFNTLGSGSWGRDIGLYKNSTGELSDAYPLEITPSGGTFSIWAFIYVWNGLLNVYALANLCRRTRLGPLYVAPGPLSVPFLVVYTLNNAANAVWLLVWDRQYVEVACFTLWLISALLWVSIALITRHIVQVRAELEKAGTAKDFWLVQGLVVNALGIYVGWTSCAMNLNLAHALIYGKATELAQSTGCTIALAVLCSLLVAYTIADFVFLDRWTRYLLTPYIPVLAALSGSISKNWNPEKHNSIFTAVMLALTLSFLLVKVILTIVRHRKQHNSDSGVIA